MSWTNIPKPNTQTYSNLSKPSAQSYTNIPKPTLGYTIRAGMATGLLMPLTYATTVTIGKSWTNINKPT